MSGYAAPVMSKNAEIAGLLRDLSSPDMNVRVGALTKLETSGPTVVTHLAAFLSSPEGSETQRVWAAIALCRTGDDARNNARSAAVLALSSRSAAIRRASLELLGRVGDDSVIHVIVAHLDDDEVATAAGFEDDRSVAEAARSALRAMGTPQAAAALSSSDAPE
jgi:HEAT repeat protein